MEIKRPVTVEFNYYNEDNDLDDDVNLTFRTTEDMRIGRLHSFCKSFAVSLGFSHEQVERVFGEDTNEEI